MNTLRPEQPRGSIPRRSINEKKRLLQSWEKSSLTMRTFCHENKISLSALKYWMRQFDMGRKRNSRRDNSSTFISHLPNSPSLTFTPFAEYILSDGSRLVINRDVDVDFLKELIAVSR